TAIVGYAGANKSKTVDLLRDTCQDIDMVLGNKLEDSRVNNSATIESLFSGMQRVGLLLLQLLDEISTFFASLGLYKATGGASYDRSLINQLYNTLRYIRHQTLDNSTSVQNPLLNIGGAGHPDELPNGIRSDMQGDGFISRFLISCPTPSIRYRCY
ncbi:unnamed protein product, partial [Didymodactylos carnosus]